MSKGWIDLETAIDRWSRHTRGHAFVLPPKKSGELKKPLDPTSRHASKLLRELRDFLVENDIAIVVRSGARYSDLTRSDRMQDFRIAFGLPSQDNQGIVGPNWSALGAETVHNRGELRTLKICEADFEKSLGATETKESPLIADPAIDWILRKDLHKHGVKIQPSQIKRLQERNEFPLHILHSERKAVYPEPEIRAWVADRVKWIAMNKQRIDKNS